MNICYLSLGSNQKSPERQIRAALNNIKKIPRTILTKISPLDWNKAWGVPTQQDFCNVLVEIRTNLNPFLLLKHCQKIERKQGRVRKKHWGPRTLDIDIIVYNTRTINNPSLTIPHPYYQDRNFVMQPLQLLCDSKLYNNLLSKHNNSTK
ncbi:2-amino-4-hydroxy-6-hydroxymethyldihydropteridine diphosphokinase [Legionella sp. km772]|uniref:2-amino-4-hydroxy-6- hydroxymethyldihydropteridine diphosphokinase n=1 Tax=Legionella sp. km772 TaxID=2498111 RepID=UPI000F8D770D|nr:2-amino-4-hydroxy-6-hydroxymethyldihydropteridine diphosphokinase [Legionella sp. km772]RUR12222.1 2-amino-4-hydroxy-6-hydroxymethyldihydropteridine diphosphokinase [Legionella sp. km772]